MIINNYILKKILLSAFLTISIIISILFIFSLLGNLGETYTFQKILYFSLLSTIQIFFQIPILVLFILLSIFFIQTKNNNELMIFMHYISVRKLFLLVLFFILLFTFIELNKSSIINKIEDIKLKTQNNNPSNLTKLFAKKDKNIKEYILLKYNDVQQFIPIEISIFEIYGKNLIKAIYSNKVEYKDDYFFLNGYSELIDDEITVVTNRLKLEEKYFSNFKNERNYFKNDLSLDLLNYDQTIKLLIIFFTSTLIFVIFINQKSVMVKNNDKRKYLVGILLVFYMYFNLNFKLSEFDFVFKNLCLIFILSLIYKNIKYE